MKTPERLYELKCSPAVFAIKDCYQIMVMSRSDCTFWVTVGDQNYYDHSNGIMRSSTRMHRVNVPMEALDAAKEYTINYRRIVDRKPYFPIMEDVVSKTFKFKPVNPEGPIKIYHLSDTHGRFPEPAEAACYFGDDIDLLVLNGDIPDHSGDIKNFDLIYKLCEAVTGGERPCVFSRGNHDTRGFFAENIADYTPTENGHSYFTFRLGRLWGIVLDTGEDKVDEHPEYGGPNAAVCCHAFRMEEDRYLKNVIKHADEEYNAEGVEYRLVIAHNPFTYTIGHPFDIEQPLFKSWVDLINENIKPDMFIAGHLHGTFVSHPGDQWDSKGQTFPVIVGGRYYRDENKKYIYIGCGITIDGKKVTADFTDQEHNVVKQETFELK